ncbi:response regulator [Stratiformator vulcanicus]|uniref:Response regulator rcp1 n=1 Tax=Stratiformator vulcanicus TaxID=2527980 RepID=A0A517R2H5_9PLAN|nr:response regulator [Stratiformator vulcanicus]QDT38085.1 Response regulator rcp1 [Stratiformator vulcanicus]
MQRDRTVGRPMEILLVEDSLTAARLTMATLRGGHLQHRITWVPNGEEAIEFVFQRGKFSRAPRPDLILLDLGLPKRDGREVLQEIKADPDLLQIPIVVLTASTSEEDRIVSERLKVESYLTKPIDMNRFLEVIKELSRFWRADMILPGPAASSQQSG